MDDVMKEVGWADHATTLRTHLRMGTFAKYPNLERAVEAALTAASAEAEGLRAEVERLREALQRQSDNMAFVLNHFNVPAQWYDKLTSELADDRATLQGGAE